MTENDEPIASLPPFRDPEETRAFLAAIVESSQDAIVGKSLDGIIRSWNRGAEHIFGYRADEVIGRSITILLPPDRLDEERDILERLRRGERIAHFDTLRVAKDGREVQVSITVSPIRDATGALVGASKVARDIGATRRAEAAAREATTSLRDSDARFRTLADNVAQLVWMAEPDGYITWYNRRWFDFTGTTLEEMQGWGWRRVHHPDHVEAVTAKCRQAIERGEEWEDTFPLRGADGEYRWFLSRALPIRDEDGKIVHWFGTNTDITERREVEESLRQVDRRKDEFLATLAHELRNPLAPISSCVELLRIAGDQPAVQRQALATLQRQSDHLVRLVDDLLDISRITRGIVELRREAVELSTLVEHAVEGSRPLISERGHALAVDLPAVPVVLEADATRLAQVISNLLDNAAKYTPPGGRIELAAEIEGEELVIRVRDNGPGIPDEMLDSVFEMFVQGERGRRGGRSGLGIGLTLVRALVEQHGGTVTARRREEATGTEVVVRLARAERGPSGDPAEALEDSREEGLRILVVDDNRDAADSLCAILRAWGHFGRAVYDGLSAIEVAAEMHPQLVLLDLGMPDIDGFETARRLRALASEKPPYLVALTGWAQASDRQRTHQAGFDDHLVKPAESSRLRSLLHRVAHESAEGSLSGKRTDSHS